MTRVVSPTWFSPVLGSNQLLSINRKGEVRLPFFCGLMERFDFCCPSDEILLPMFFKIVAHVF